MPERRISNLFARRSATRDSLHEAEATFGIVTGVSAPLPSLPPVRGAPYESSYNPQETMSEGDWHAMGVQPTPPQPPLGMKWPPCPLSDHTTCPDGAVFFYSNAYPGKQQTDLLKNKNLGADFFNGGNPPPGVWAALWRTISCEKGRERREDRDLIYAYRISHCPRRRADILGIRMEQERREEAVRLRKAKVGR